MPEVTQVPSDSANCGVVAAEDFANLENLDFKKDSQRDESFHGTAPYRHHQNNLADSLIMDLRANYNKAVSLSEGSSCNEDVLDDTTLGVFLEAMMEDPIFDF